MRSVRQGLTSDLKVKFIEKGSTPTIDEDVPAVSIGP
jgi:hypothetical protein